MANVKVHQMHRQRTFIPGKCWCSFAASQLSIEHGWQLVAHDTTSLCTLQPCTCSPATLMSSLKGHMPCMQAAAKAQAEGEKRQKEEMNRRRSRLQASMAEVSRFADTSDMGDTIFGIRMQPFIGLCLFGVLVLQWFTKV